MNQSVPLYSIFAVLGAAIALWLLYRIVSEATASAKALTAALVDATGKLKGLQDQIQPAVSEVRTNMAGVPKLLESVAQIGQAQLEVLQAQRAEQARRERNPFGRPNAPVPPRDVEAANLEAEVQAAMRAEGITREEALLRMNPANARSVWEGDELTRGWR